MKVVVARSNHPVYSSLDFEKCMHWFGLHKDCFLACNQSSYNLSVEPGLKLDVNRRLSKIKNYT